MAARDRRARRGAPTGPGTPPAATLDVLSPRLTPAGLTAVEDAHRSGRLGARSRRDVLAVAATVADLAGEALITLEAVNTALDLRGDRLARL